MYLHLGEDVIIPKGDIIGVFDYTNSFQSLISKEFIELARSEDKIRQIGIKEKIKTFIITDEEIYLSPISSNTLLKRSYNLFAIGSEF